MRRPEKEIKEIVVLEEILREQPIGRLGLCNENVPYVIPMNFAYDHGNILLHSYNEGKKYW